MSSASLPCCPALLTTSTCGRSQQRRRRCPLLSRTGESCRRAPVWHHLDLPALPCGPAWVSVKCKCPRLRLRIALRPTARPLTAHLSHQPATTMGLRSSLLPSRCPACLLLIAELAWVSTTSVGIAIRSTPRRCDNQRLPQQTPVIQPRRLPHERRCSGPFGYFRSQDAVFMPIAAG